MTKWQKYNKEERETVKFLKTGTEIEVLIDFEPKFDPAVKGKYGDRPMYIINTKEYGLIYVSPRQFIKIAESIADKTVGTLHTEL